MKIYLIRTEARKKTFCVIMTNFCKNAVILHCIQQAQTFTKYVLHLGLSQSSARENLVPTAR